jgi:hypothetical protein
MRWVILLMPLFVLSGCFEEIKVVDQTPAESQCYEIYTSAKQDPLLLDKCKGRTWLLSKVALLENGKDTGTFTYRWSPLAVENIEPVLSIPAYRP